MLFRSGVDNLKSINILHGRTAGDSILRKIASVLEELLDIRSGFTPERIERSARQTGNLIALGQRQANRRIRNMYLNWKIKRAVNL